MSAIVLLDTSVFLNILDVPGFSQDREDVFREFTQKIETHDHFLLPMAAVWETGNHIAHLADGNVRRRYAQDLVNQVSLAISGKTPFAPTYFPNQQVFLEWLRMFPEHAQRNKSVVRTGEGTSLADLSIIKEYEFTVEKNPMSQVLIWSLDIDLAAYDTGVRE